MPPTNPDDPIHSVDPRIDHDLSKATPGTEHTAVFAPVSSPNDGIEAKCVPVPGTEAMAAMLERGSETVSVPGYDIEGVLGRGGMGVVFKARHLALKRTVALKMVLAGGHAGPRELTRFRIEAEAVARVQHPNIVQIHEVGEAGGHPYCALEFVEGGNLAGKLDGKPMPARAAAKLVAALARAMQLAHSRNVVHRDLKPANILLAADGTPKITDFGLARQIDSDSGETQAGAVMGTPSYMAPEQASGHAHEAGPAADVYALGAILYDCLAGRPPFKGKTIVETLDQVRTREAVPPSRWQARVPLDLDTICLKCLQKAPENRYASAAELADELVRYEQGEPILARQLGRIERTLRWCRRNPALALATGLATVAVMTVTAVSIAFAFSQSRSNTKLTAAYDELSHEQGRTQIALNDSQRLASELALEKGQLLGEQEDANGAILWIARGLKLAPVDADDLQSLGRANLGYWRTRISPLRDILQHDSQLGAVRYMEDGKAIFTGDLNCTLQHWDATTGEPIGNRIGHPIPRSGNSNTFQVAFSPDGRSCLTEGADNTAQLYEVATGKLIRRLELGGWIRTAAFSSDGRLLIGIVGSQGESVQLWSVATGKPLCPLLRHENLVLSLAFNPDGKTFATESGIPDRGPGIARFWRADGLEIRKPLDHPSGALGLAFSPDGKKLLTGHFDGKARLWDLSTDQLLFPPLAHQALVAPVAFSPNGETLLTGSFDGTARLWDTSTGKPRSPPLHHEGMVRWAAFSPDSKTFATGAGDNTVRVWEVAAKTSVAAPLPYEELYFPLSFCPDRQTIMTRDAHNSVRLRNAMSGKLLGNPLRHEFQVTAGTFSADLKTAVTVEDKNTGGAWDTTTTRLWDVPTGNQIGPSLDHNIVNAAAYSPDGKTVVTGGLGEAHFWDATTGAKMTIRASSHDNRHYAVAFSPDGKSILTGGSVFITQLLEAASDVKIVEPIRVLTTGVLATAFSCDGKTILTGSTDNTARLWESATGKQIGPPLTHLGAVNAVAFSRDGKTALTGSRDKTARLWDTATGRPLGPPLQDLLNPSPVNRVAFWHDDRFILTGGEDQCAHFWQLSEPVAGDVEQLELWSQVVTGMELEANGGVRALNATTWQERRLKLKNSGFQNP